ncbi:MAG TPA: lipoate--protein ligase family protein [Candidatus Didemnitutus sp.]|nr:lipoate--protein ligase family protein [Candidatus Didemnitutus sp.]
MKLHVLPTRSGAAAENMALDFLLLQRYPGTEARFRHYEWRRPACTFGFSQKIEFVRAHLPADNLDLCRRPTGGGIVDHRNDWTYSLVIPRGYPLYDEAAPLSYRLVHEAVVGALIACGQPAGLQPTRPEPGEAAEPGPAGVCFQRAEIHDVVNPETGAKIAGAAQKRNKNGLLLQGSLEKATIREIDWERFAQQLADALARCLRTQVSEVPWPDLDESEVDGLTEQYSSPEWLEYR